VAAVHGCSFRQGLAIVEDDRLVRGTVLIRG